ncbi:hypothetical protein [Comamonas antarctica]|uniref:hypothetical protein n=1 Tax=Comamonas antarctica TaxID=2743470 RepID=UPI0028ECC03A|nr:hypothetical protein [Comamonas antarctica]
MNIFYSRIPAAAIKNYFDGKRYANIPHRMRDGRVIEDYENPAMMQFGPDSFIKNGEAYVPFAKRGDALPLPYVPFGVTVINMPDEAGALENDGSNETPSP